MAWLKIPDAAKALGMTENWVRVLVKRAYAAGDPSVRIQDCGHYWRYEIDVEAFRDFHSRQKRTRRAVVGSHPEPEPEPEPTFSFLE